MKKLQEIALFGAVSAVAVTAAAALSGGTSSPAMVQETAGAPAPVKHAVEQAIRGQMQASLSQMLAPEKGACQSTDIGAVMAAPGTPQEKIDETIRRMEEWLADNPWEGEGEGTARFQAGDRWGGIFNNGNPVTLTYSFPPDGTGTSGGPNQLNATLDAIYGSTSAWKNIFAQEFQRWADATGNVYTEVSDDGATWSSAPGPFNGGSNRGDVRIVMGNNDGPSNVLAFNFFPDNGDMFFDVAENWGNTTFLRNVLSHEHGHGLGLEHVCPANGTKLMEPFANFLVGPQFDDRLAGQFLYGDRFEPNNTGGTAVNLNSVFGLTNNGIPRTVEELSLHDFISSAAGDDFDLLRFEALNGAEINVQVRPVGFSYAEGPQTPSCNSGPTFNAREVADLIVEILRPNFTVLASANDFGLGASETLQGITTDADGFHYIRIRSANSNFGDAQMYDVTVSYEGGGAPPNPADLSGDGCVDATDLAILVAAWATDGGDISGDGTTNAVDLASLVAAWTGSNCN